MNNIERIHALHPEVPFMGEVGQVIEKENRRLTIRLKRTEACAKCKACVAGLNSQDMILTAENACEAAVGDFVELELKDGYFIKAILIMYGFPLVMLIFGFLAGAYLFKLFVGGYSDLAGFLTGIFFMLASYFLINRHEKKKKSSGFTPVAIKIVEPPDEKE